MKGYEGIKFVLDLEACLDFGNAGQNRKLALFKAAEVERVAITSEVYRQLKIFDSALAKEFENSSIEIVEYNEVIYRTTETLAKLLIINSNKLDNAASEKLPILAVVNCAQNGTDPKCALVTGDVGKHRSSMSVLCQSLKITAIPVGIAF